MSLKTRLPWWSKIGAKIVLSRLPAGYRAWERAGLFVHGAMDDPAYAIRVVRAHLARAGWPDFAGRRLVELGPGDSLATAVIARALGATETWLVDAGAFARTDMEPYIRLASALRAEGLQAPEIHNGQDAAAMLRACNAHYLTAGLASLRELPSGQVDLFFSQAVLEHVRLGEFLPVLREMHRVLAPGGLASHQIDLKDHLAAGLNHLRFRENVWESPLMAQSGFYTNRLRRTRIVELFETAGFATTVDDVRRWPQLPIPRRKLDPAFRGLSDDELLISQFDVFARPR